MSQICDSVLIFRLKHYHTWTEKIPCHAMLCLSFLSVGLPATAEDSTEAGGVTDTLTPLLWLSWSNVSLLKKTNADTRGWPRYYVLSNMLLV